MACAFLKRPLSDRMAPEADYAALEVRGSRSGSTSKLLSRLGAGVAAEFGRGDFQRPYRNYGTHGGTNGALHTRCSVSAVLVIVPRRSKCRTAELSLVLDP